MACWVWKMRIGDPGSAGVSFSKRPGQARACSSNLDHRSFGLDDELNLATRDPEVVGELAGHFLEDLEASKEFDLDRWRQRSLAKRATESTLDLLRQSL